MKKMRVVALIGLFAILNVSADIIELDLLGDIDGFGVGCPIGDGYDFTDYGAYWADYRETIDPSFTDYWHTGDQSWSHTITVPNDLTSAELEIFVAGIADNVSWSADVYADEILIGTLDGIAGAHDDTRLLTFDITSVILDGVSDIRLDVSYDGDGYIIDYSKVVGTTSSVPEPASLSLILLGLVGLVGARKR